MDSNQYIMKKSGIINVYKEAGFTSFDVVAKLRGILHTKKIGHTGTLDPDATGVLPVCIGKATKVCDLLTDKDKEYEAVILLGITTDTYDASGKVLKEASIFDYGINDQKIIDVIQGFVGEQLQIPPMYSALKVNGKKLYEYARNGIEIERKPRPVTIYHIEIENITLPRIKIKVHCSKGTYIRSLCHDIGQSLGCGACMESLVRTRVANFSIENALHLSEIEELVQNNEIDDFILGIDAVFAGCPGFLVNKDAEVPALNGGYIPYENCCQIPLGMSNITNEANEEDASCHIEAADCTSLQELNFNDRCLLYFEDMNHFLGTYHYDGNGFKLEKNFREA